MSEDLVTEALLEFLNGCESAIMRAKQTITERMKLEENMDFSKLFWAITYEC